MRGQHERAAPRDRAGGEKTMTSAQWTAIRRALLAAGHTPADINAAWQAAAASGLSQRDRAEVVAEWIQTYLKGKLS